MTTTSNKVMLISSSIRTTREQINAWQAEKDRSSGEGYHTWWGREGGGATSSYREIPLRTPSAVASSF